MELSAEFAVKSKKKFENELFSKSLCKFKSKIKKIAYKNEERKLRLVSKSANIKTVSLKGSLSKHLKKLESRLQRERVRNDRLQKYLKKLFVQKNELITQLRLAQNRREEIKREYAAYREYKSKEIRRAREELAEISKEYYQVMSERDAMNKDMQALEEKMMKIEEINSHIIHSQSHNSSCMFGKSSLFRNKFNSLFCFLLI